MNTKDRKTLEDILFRITFRESQFHQLGRLMWVILKKIGYKRVDSFFLELLTPREKKIIEERFGFNRSIPKTYEEVGKECGVTRERIRQIESKAIDKITDSIIENSHLCGICQEKLKH